MNRNRLKKNLKKIVDEERHLRFVYDRGTSMYVPYENVDEMRLMTDHWEMYKIAFGHIDNETGLYVEDDFTESYYSPDCLMFDDPDYYVGVKCFVTYPLYSDTAYEITGSGEEVYLSRSFTMYELEYNLEEHRPLGYTSRDMFYHMVPLVE